MSIANRIQEAMFKYWIDELDNALIQVMILIDWTARKEFPDLSNKARFTNFINDNLDIISKVTFFRFKLNIDDKFNIILVENRVKEVTFAEFIYYIRCDILHEWFTKDIIWNKKSLKYENGENYIPKSVLLWLIIAVLWSETNKDEIINHWVWSKIPVLELFYKEKGIRIPFDRYLWKKTAIMKLIQTGLWDPV